MALLCIITEEDFVEEERMVEDIEREEYDMGGLTEDYMDGDYFGGEEENWGDYEQNEYE